jgi:hypothetical protein
VCPEVAHVRLERHPLDTVITNGHVYGHEDRDLLAALRASDDHGHGFTWAQVSPALMDRIVAVLTP